MLLQPDFLALFKRILCNINTLCGDSVYIPPVYKNSINIRICEDLPENIRLAITKSAKQDFICSFDHEKPGDSAGIYLGLSDKPGCSRIESVQADIKGGISTAVEMVLP